MCILSAPRILNTSNGKAKGGHIVVSPGIAVVEVEIHGRDFGI